jgi:hypothetical protein
MTISTTSLLSKRQTRYDSLNVMNTNANIRSESEPLDRDNTSVNSDGDGQQAIEVIVSPSP